MGVAFQGNGNNGVAFSPTAIVALSGFTFVELAIKVVAEVLPVRSLEIAPPLELIRCKK